MTAPFLSTRMALGCPSIRCFPCSSLRTRYMDRRRRLSTGRRSTLSRTVTACASSCAGSTRRQAKRYATSGSTCSLWGPRPSCWDAGRAAHASRLPAVRLVLALRTRRRAPRRAVLARDIIGQLHMYAILPQV
jgi:hypothetical protein